MSIHLTECVPAPHGIYVFIIVNIYPYYNSVDEEIKFHKGTFKMIGRIVYYIECDGSNRLCDYLNVSLLLMST